MRTLEEKGIGRPSTYASIINTIQERDYVKKLECEAGADGDRHGGQRSCWSRTFLTSSRSALHGAGSRVSWTTVEDGDESVGGDLLNGFYDHFEKELRGRREARWKT